MDFELQDHGTIWTLRPVTVAAIEWVQEHLPADCAMLGDNYCIEARYISDIVEGIVDDGLMIHQGPL